MTVLSCASVRRKLAALHDGELTIPEVIAMRRGGRVVRVHDVGWMAKVARMTDAIVKNT